MEKLKSPRIQSIDILRGLVMVIMALDHVRDYFHINAFMGNYPENMDTTSPELFLTRFITHYCAPVFVFLAGTSAFLYGQSREKKQLSKFLISRGIWLVFVEIFIMNFLWWFDITYGFFNLQVIWAIGICMIILGILVWLPKKAILAIGFIIVFGHNLLDGISAEGNSPISLLWYFLHQSQGVQLGGRLVWFAYPVMAWIGVMALGYCFGEFYQKGADAEYRKRWLMRLGISAIVIFFLIRGLNGYGDLNPWQNYEPAWKTIISFFNVTKYPPSLAFILVTLGPALIFLVWIEKFKTRITDFLLVFGRVPFFFYVLHVLVIHLVAMIGLILTGKPLKTLVFTNDIWTSDLLQDYGYSLFTVYLVWIGVVAFLYYPCLKYMQYKLKNRQKAWLSYL